MGLPLYLYANSDNWTALLPPGRPGTNSAINHPVDISAIPAQMKQADIWNAAILAALPGSSKSRLEAGVPVPELLSLGEMGRYDSLEKQGWSAETPLALLRLKRISPIDRISG